MKKTLLLLVSVFICIGAAYALTGAGLERNLEKSILKERPSSAFKLLQTYSVDGMDGSLYVVQDKSSGFQYLTGKYGVLTPRLNALGRPICGK